MAQGYLTRESMRKSLTNQAPMGPHIVEHFEAVRVPALALMETIFDLCPETPERSLALRELESTLMWAIKSIAVNQSDIPG